MSLSFRYGLLVLGFLFILSCAENAKGPAVKMIYPSAKEVPENLLRMYVQFSQPMKTIGNLERIKLLDEKGKEVKNVFFNNVHELWNNDQTQLTLLLDPARVKTGLKVNESVGRALVPGHNYTLVIEGLENVYHEKMQTPFEKKISVRKADLTIPETKKWRMHIPAGESKEALEIHFQDMLDYHSLQRRLVVIDLDNQPIKGRVSIKENETVWNFIPHNDWNRGSYLLHVNYRLEDPAGNNLNGLFDHKIGSLKYKKEGVVIPLPFKIK